MLVRLGDEIDLTLNRRVHALDTLIRRSAIDGVIETVPAYASLLVHYDPLKLTYAGLRDRLRAKLEKMQDASPGTSRLFEVPVRYGGEPGPDLEFIASYQGLRVEDIIRIHSEKIYTIYMMGFTPGFPYMGKLDDAIATPRLETPRTHVPAGSVGIAGSQTGIYPIDSPGGWRLIGQTSLRILDPDSGSPFLFSPGDQVRFTAED